MKERILSGIRPTGKLHWGHYFGVIKNWCELQNKYDCFYFIADWHALTSEYANTDIIKPSVYEMLVDLFAAGLDAKKVKLFIQSDVKEHAELHLLLSMITPISWLERVPSYKDMQLNLTDKDLSNYGFLGYPLLQTADILLYGSHKVPVGEDQVAHIELSREIVRRFHFITKQQVFVEPQPLLTKASKVPGLDGRKMSKSFNNAIYLSDDEETITKKMMQTITDPERKFRKDPGHPEVCNIFAYHKLYTDTKEISEIKNDCKQAKIGCVDCKKICIKNALEFWKPFNKKRSDWLDKKDEMMKIVKNGAKVAQIEADKTMQEVRKAMGISY